MILDVFAELQRPGPRSRGFERRLYADTLEQAVLADAMGFGCWWAVEHHGSPEFSYSSAPDLMLAVLSQHTSRIRLGHSGVLGAFAINHPMRVAERAAFLDNVSGGRLELGLARSVPHEWETFGCDADATRRQIQEALRILPRMWAEGPFSSDDPRPADACAGGRAEAAAAAASAALGHLRAPGRLRARGAPRVGVLAHGDALAARAPRELLGRLPPRPRGLRAGRRRGQSRSARSSRSSTAPRRASEAIASRAAEAALWFMNAQPDVFGDQPRALAADAAREARRSGATSTCAFRRARPRSPAISTIPMPVIALMNRLRAGIEIDPVEAYEALLPLDSVVIGDVETCRRKLAGYEALGVDRLMCLMQMGELPHEQVLSSLRAAGKFLIPELAR